MSKTVAMMLGIHYLSPQIEALYREKAGVKETLSSGFDLINIEKVIFTKEHPVQLVNLGVVIKPPEGFHSILMPRSSLYKKFNVMQTNSLGLIDESYCGKEDIWRIPLIWIPENSEKFNSVIPAGTRVCQFFLQPIYRFHVMSYNPPETSRGGFGSTGQ